MHSKTDFIEALGRVDTIDEPCVPLYCVFDKDRFQDTLFKQLNVEFPEHLIKAVTKRKAEYLAGRLVAQLAIEELIGFQQPVATGKKREPLWPTGIVGSISHTANLAICLLSNDPQHLIGVDIEQVLTSETATNVHSSIVTADEINRLEQYHHTLRHKVTLAFSAKESLFKALYPKVGFYFDFYAAEVIVINPEANSLILQLTQDLGEHFNRGDRFLLRYQVFQGCVLTYLLASL